MMCYEEAVKQGFNDHSRPRCDGTSTIRRETGFNAWLNEYSLARWDGASTMRRETAVKGWIRQSLTG